MELQEAFTNLTEKFTSGNIIPVERNTITRIEWEPICAVIAEALKPSHNTDSPKLPPFAEWKTAIERDMGYLLGKNDLSILKLGYIVLERQLLAGA